jgi:hypothetical protein
MQVWSEWISYLKVLSDKGNKARENYKGGRDLNDFVAFINKKLRMLALFCSERINP